MIIVKNLSKGYNTTVMSKNFISDIFARKYKDTIALKNISFEVRESELVGLIGPNGAGKTTTLKILSGILYPTSGTCKVLGMTPFDKKPEFLKQISFIMGQRNQLFWDLPASDTFYLNKGRILYDGSQAEIVKKYSNEKYVTVILERQVEQKVLALISKPIVYNFPR